MFNKRKLNVQKFCIRINIFLIIRVLNIDESFSKVIFCHRTILRVKVILEDVLVAKNTFGIHKFYSRMLLSP